MGLFSNIFNRNNPVRITKGSTIDEYVMRNLIASLGLQPDYASGTYLDSYTGNGDVFTVINKITEPGSVVPVFQYDAAGEINENGRMIQLLNNPNPYMGRAEFLEALMTFYLIFGDAYASYERVPNGLNANLPIRLDVLPPQWVEFVIGTYLDPIAGYKLILSDKAIDYEKERVMHWKEFNPDYDNQGTGHLKGMSRLKPLLKSVVGSGSAYDALVSTLQHQGAVGILTLLGEDAKPQKMTAPFLSKVKQQLRDEYFNNKKAGSVVITDKEHHWTRFGLSAVEMSILDAIGTFGGKLYDAYNVPSVLMSGSKDKTYMNFTEAKKALYQDAIMPTLDSALDKLTHWLAPAFGEVGQTLKADYSGISVLQTNKAEMVAWMVLARSFTRNEIREAAGYDHSDDPAMDKVYDSAGMVPIEELGLMPSAPLTEEVMKRLRMPDYRQKN